MRASPPARRACTLASEKPLSVKFRVPRAWVSTGACGINRRSLPPSVTPARTRADPALVKALASAHRWKRLLESGRYGSLAELAAAAN